MKIFIKCLFAKNKCKEKIKEDESNLVSYAENLTIEEAKLNDTINMMIIGRGKDLTPLIEVNKINFYRCSYYGRCKHNYDVDFDYKVRDLNFSILAHNQKVQQINEILKYIKQYNKKDLYYAIYQKDDTYFLLSCNILEDIIKSGINNFKNIDLSINTFRLSFERITRVGHLECTIKKYPSAPAYIALDVLDVVMDQRKGIASKMIQTMIDISQYLFDSIKEVRDFIGEGGIRKIVGHYLKENESYLVAFYEKNGFSVNKETTGINKDIFIGRK